MKSLTVLAIALTFLAVAPSAVPAQSRSRSAAPAAMVDVDTAVSVWSTRQRDNETTDAFRARVTKDIRTLLGRDRTKLDYDSDYWRLLSYLGALPYDKLTPQWKDWFLAKMPNPRLTDEQRADLIARIEPLPIYKMTPKEVDVYITHVHETIPDLRDRIMHLARKNLGQPYQIYLLGEYPYEVYDPDPLYMLSHSDCVVFSEHTYAMAFTNSWREFFPMLQKIRYKDGEIGMVTRNHVTEADWNKNNTWFLKDVTTELGATTVTAYESVIDRARFFRNFGIGQDVPKETLNDHYIPADAIYSVLDKLEAGDFVNIARGRGTSAWIGHVGLVGIDENGMRTFIHSTTPVVKEEPIMEYVRRNQELNVGRLKEDRPVFLGMKFLKLRDDAPGGNAAH